MKKDEYFDIYEDVVVVFDQCDGEVEKKSHCFTWDNKFIGKTNKVDGVPDDILQVAVRCLKCGEFMNYEKSSEWMNGKYTCACGDEVDERVLFEQLEENSKAFYDYDDIYR